MAGVKIVSKSLKTEKDIKSPSKLIEFSPMTIEHPYTKGLREKAKKRPKNDYYK